MIANRSSIFFLASIMRHPKKVSKKNRQIKDR